MLLFWILFYPGYHYLSAFRVNAKGEENFRPLIETVLTDLLRVAADAPVEWPVASLILSVFGQSFMQLVNSPSSTTSNSSRAQIPGGSGGSGSSGNLTGNSSASSGRSADPNTRAIALECLITLAGGMYQLEKIRSSAKKAGGDITEARNALSAFLGSPILGLYNLTLTTDDAPNTIAGPTADYVKQREFAYKLISRLRYTYFDGLSLVGLLVFSAQMADFFTSNKCSLQCVFLISKEEKQIEGIVCKKM